MESKWWPQRLVVVGREFKFLEKVKIVTLGAVGTWVYVGSLLGERVVGGSLCPGDIVRGSLPSCCGERREWEALRYGVKVYFSRTTDTATGMPTAPNVQSDSA